MRISTTTATCVVLLGCSIHYFLSSCVASLGSLTRLGDLRDGQSQSGMEFQADDCFRRMLQFLKADKENPFDGVSIVLHRNGETDPCFTTNATTNILEEMKTTLQTMEYCPVQFADKKYQVESFLSRMLHRIAHTCTSKEFDRVTSEGFLGYCDMGEAKTPILLDHDKVIPIKTIHLKQDITYLPCHFHSRNGIRISSLATLTDHALEAKASFFDSFACQTMSEASQDELCQASQNNRELHLYAVPTGRMFMFAPSHVNEVIELPHVTGANASEFVYMQVLSLSPRVFELFNFFSKEESSDLVLRALDEQRDSHRIKRSSTGAQGSSVSSRRTSESGYDTTGQTAVAIKRRCFDLLGFDHYTEEHADGLQMLRYNASTSYASHLDYFEGGEQLDHDYDSAHKGGNRFATVLLYMTDMEAGSGGETVFVSAWPQDQSVKDRVNLNLALQRLRDSGDAAVFEEGSWQEDMVAKCRSRLSIESYAGRAILFYSQLPNGQVDRTSLHGGCPVLRGTKPISGSGTLLDRDIRDTQRTDDMELNEPVNSFTSQLF